MSAAPRDNLRAGILILVSSGAFTLNDALVKQLTQEHPVAQILCLRGALVCVCLVLVMPLLGERLTLAHLTQRHVLGRAVCDTAATWCFVAAASLLPLADAMTIFFAGPIILTALSVPLLGERVGPRRWAAVLVGFLGVVIAAQPTGEWRPAVGLALAAAFLGATRDILTRLVPPVAGPATIALTTSAAIVVATLPSALLAWSPLGWLDLALLAGATVLLTIAYLAFVSGLRTGDIGVVSPLRYAAVPYAMLWGLVLFGDRPAAATWAGAVIVVGAGLYIVLRERQLARQRARP